MKKLLPLLLLLSACDKADDLEEFRRRDSESRQKDSINVIRELKYYRQTSSGLCFAANCLSLGWGSSYVFTWVPCDKIPPNLITEVNEEESKCPPKG